MALGIQKPRIHAFRQFRFTDRPAKLIAAKDTLYVTERRAAVIYNFGQHIESIVVNYKLYYLINN